MAANSQLASSIFSRTPDESTVVEDIYKKTNTDVVTSFQDSTGNSFELSDQFSFLSKFNSGLNVTSGNVFDGNADSVTDTITSSISDDYSKAKTLVGDAMSGSKTAQATLRSNLNSVTGMLRNASDAYYQVNGVVNAVKKGNLKDLRNITNTLNAVVGRTAVALSPNGALGTIYGSLVDQASAAGISDAFSVVADSVRTSTTLANKSNIMYGMATTSLPGAVARGDLRSVASMTDFIGNGAIGMMNPSAVRQISRNNRTSYTPSQIGGSDGQFVQYQSAYQKIDPNWNQSSWKPVGTSTPFCDMTALLDASAETRQVFTTGAKQSANPNDKYFSILDSFKGPLSVNDEISRRYPMMPAGKSTNMCSRDVDPRVYIDPKA